jgi:hypothetical protein
MITKWMRRALGTTPDFAFRHRRGKVRALRLVSGLLVTITVPSPPPLRTQYFRSLLHLLCVPQEHMTTSAAAFLQAGERVSGTPRRSLYGLQVTIQGTGGTVVQFLY